MECKKCGASINETSKFCDSCGEKVEQENKQQKTPISSEISNNQKSAIKCMNCNYEGEGEPARSMVSKILAWLAVPFMPLVTILYFVITSKYRCPHCKSTFLGVRGKDGVLKGQGQGGRWLTVVIVIFIGIMVVGILSSVVLASLNSAREKSRDARRISDVKQLQLALELYYDDTGSYPTENSFKNLSPRYLTIIPTDPIGGNYNYSYCSPDTYHLGTSLEGLGNTYLNRDADAQFLCEGDSINGLDSGKCSVSDSGSYCFDVTSNF